MPVVADLPNEATEDIVEIRQSLVQAVSAIFAARSPIFSPPTARLLRQWTYI